MNKKILIALSLLLYVVSTYIAYSLFVDEKVIGIKSPIIPEKAGSASTLQVATDEPKTEECPINGELLPKSFRKIWEGRRPMGAMIENHLDSRPQSGLSDADVVYEAVAEGGITRFLAVFYCKDAKLIGPIRSARVYFIRMLAEYGDYPLYPHVGGANTPGPADALGLIRKLKWDGYNDMNQFSIPFPYYYRDYERNPGVATEHTMYASTQKLWEYARTKRDLTNVDEDGNKWDDSFTKWTFRDEGTEGDTRSVSFDFWEGKSAYSVRWDYDAATKSYRRFHGSTPHTDKNTGKQLATRNVIVAFMKESSANDGYPGGHMLYKTEGTGKTLVFQEGNVIEGTWSKKDMFSRMRFADNSGKEIPILRGQVFIEIVPEGNVVNY